MIQTIRGTFDILPDEIPRWRRVEETAREIFRRYGFREIRTPIFERTELFARSVGAETDIVAKEMYTFTDRSGESLSLRPESTASVVRAYIEHRMWLEADPIKLFYIGPHFRYERPQKGRFRQFHQLGAEVIGTSDDPAIDADVIEMLEEYFAALGVTDREVALNSVGCRVCRPVYVEKLKAALAPVVSQMCSHCQRRYETNPLRVLDCKIESDQPLIEGLPTLLESLCPECSRHLADVRSHLRARRIEYRVAPRLVRGLDYYTRTAFEVTGGGLGAQNAIAGGGRYDGLSETLGGPPAKGFGFACGMERLLLALPPTGDAEDDQVPDLYIAALGAQARAVMFDMARRLRRSGVVVVYDYEEKKLKKLLAQANRMKARFALLLGEDELASGLFTLRDMRSGVQERVPEGELLSRIRAVKSSPLTETTGA